MTSIDYIIEYLNKNNVFKFDYSDVTENNGFITCDVSFMNIELKAKIHKRFAIEVNTLFRQITDKNKLEEIAENITDRFRKIIIDYIYVRKEELIIITNSYFGEDDAEKTTN